MGDGALAWSDLLGAPLPAGTVRVVLDHEPVRRFRWFVLVELALGSVALLCLLPLWAALSLWMGQPLGVDLTELELRFFRMEHRLRVRGQQRDGARSLLWERTLRTADERDRVVASALLAAEHSRLVVVQQVAGAWAATCYGGRPLLAPPDLPSVDASAQVVEGAPGVTLTRTPTATQVRVAGRGPGRALAAFRLVLVGWLRVWSAEGRAANAADWRAARGGPPPDHLLEVQAHRIRTGIEVDGVVDWTAQVDGADLVTVTYAPALGVGDRAAPGPARLRIVGRSSTPTVEAPLPDGVGSTVALLVLAASLEHRARAPQLGLAFTLEGVTHCAYCGTLFDLGAEPRCPSCGSPPTLLPTGGR